MKQIFFVKAAPWSSKLDSQVETHSLKHFPLLQIFSNSKCMSDKTLIFRSSSSWQTSDATRMNTFLVPQGRISSETIIEAPVRCHDSGLAQATVRSHSCTCLLHLLQSRGGWYCHRAKIRKQTMGSGTPFQKNGCSFLNGFG